MPRARNTSTNEEARPLFSLSGSIFLLEIFYCASAVPNQSSASAQARLPTSFICNHSHRLVLALRFRVLVHDCGLKTKLRIFRGYLMCSYEFTATAPAVMVILAMVGTSLTTDGQGFRLSRSGPLYRGYILSYKTSIYPLPYTLNAVTV